VRVERAVSGQAALTFPAGEPPAPQGIVLPAPGVVQQYPFDSYTVRATVQANVLPADTSDPIATEASLFFRVPGWSDQDTMSAPGTGTAEVVSTQLVRDGSTRSIALLLLLLMIILASIAIMVTGSATRGRMKLELSVASWMTGLLFAMIPLRGFFPGSDTSHHPTYNVVGELSRAGSAIRRRAVAFRISGPPDLAHSESNVGPWLPILASIMQVRRTLND